MEMDLGKRDLGVQFCMNEIDTSEIIVSIACTTYNHVSYIRRCLDGFMMQQTNFAFEVLIHDDASTDGTADIIREYELRYPDIIKPIYQKENQYSKGIGVMATYNFSRAKGKYIAMCEGDDYWIDPFKLQKQVDFLDNNRNYYLVGMRSYIYYQNKGVIDYFNYSLHFISSFDISCYVKTILMHTSTFCIRKEFVMTNNSPKNIMQGDISLVLHSYKKESKIKVLKEFGSVYRIHDGGVTNSNNNKNKFKAYNSYCCILDSFNKKTNFEYDSLIEYVKKRNYVLMKMVSLNSFKERIHTVCENLNVCLRFFGEWIIRRIELRILRFLLGTPPENI